MNLIIMPLKKIAKLLFNRIFYVAVALLLQLVWVFLFVWELAGYSQYISLAITVLSIVMVLWILNKLLNGKSREKNNPKGWIINALKGKIKDK